MPRTPSPIRRSPDLHGGQPLFAGSTVPVLELVRALRRGESVEEFLARFPELDQRQVLAVVVWAVDELVERERLPPVPSQASLLPRTDERGVIINTAELRSDQVVGRKALCPACRRLVFQSWPEGWDAHAEHRCGGITAVEPARRKQEFKKRYGHLFRLPGQRPSRGRS